MSRLSPQPVSQSCFTPFVLGLLLTACGLSPLRAATDSTVDIAEREVQRRAALLSTQAQRLTEAEALLKARKAGPALALYEEIFSALPNLPLAQEVRVVALEGYLHAGLMRAQELMNAGDYPAAVKILDTLDGPNVAKGHQGIREMRARLNDPDRYPPALTPQHVERVQEVQRLLTLAASQYETGMYDTALTTYEEVLRLDATNSAARRGMERVESERSRYFDAARDHQRGRMLNGVSELWDVKPSLRSSDITSLFGGGVTQPLVSAAKGGRDSIVAKLRDIKIERIDFSGAALEEVIEYLRVRARDLDPTGKGVDFVMSVPKDAPLKSVSLNLTNVPIEEVLRYVTEVTGVSYRVEEFAVRIVSLTDTNQSIISKSYRVPPDFISTAPSGPVAGAAVPADPFATQNPAAPAGGTLLRRLGAKEFLESRGVTFPEGSGASYNPVVNMLTVRNTAKNIEFVDTLVEQSLNVAPKMAVIEVKIVEINNNKLDEMGFDWLLEGFGSQYEFSGGTVGNAQNSTFRVNEFPENAALSATGMAPVTAGLRSSGDLGNRGIEDVLYGAVSPASRRSPGVLSLAGVLTNPQFQVVWRALDQKTGIDLISRPSVIAKTGQKASVEVVREFIYPTEYDPPQIPTNVGTQPNVIIIGPPLPLPPIPVTPTTPTAFETRRVGMVLDVEPVISEDGRSVDLTLTPEFTEFVGFVNYGSPIYNVMTLAGGLGSSKTELTPNVIAQPIFSTKKIVTGVKVYDGATVVLGGLISDQSIIIDDHIPVIGDLPLVGKLFSSKVKQRRMKNMIMFVTVKVVDPSGNRINRQ